jgi:hypothetical protein
MKRADLLQAPIAVLTDLESLQPPRDGGLFAHFFHQASRGVGRMAVSSMDGPGPERDRFHEGGPSRNNRNRAVTRRSSLHFGCDPSPTRISRNPRIEWLSSLCSHQTQFPRSMILSGLREFVQSNGRPAQRFGLCLVDPLTNRRILIKGSPRGSD